jgi:hypothetical protein
LNSPYQNSAPEAWLKITQQLIEARPLSSKDMVGAVQQSWQQIFESKIGPLSIGVHIFPTPQIIGAILHELIPYNLAAMYPTMYKVGNSKTEKDIVCVADNSYSIEIKTSSNPREIFANRSYAQPTSPTELKPKNGYYLTINFERFIQLTDGSYKPLLRDESEMILYPQILQIKFGYLEHTDWIPQNSATGQQARLNTQAKRMKLLRIYPLN